MKQVQVYLKFKSTENVDPSVEDFIEMLQLINDCHNMLISLSQKEYEGLLLPKRDTFPIIDNHKLKISTIKRENPFNVDFVFDIDPEQLIEFLKILKLCFFPCGIYKTSSSNLFNDVLKWFKKKNKNENDDESSKNLKLALKKIFPHIMKLNKILCNNKFKIIDLFYNFGGEIFKIIENEEYKRED